MFVYGYPSVRNDACTSASDAYDQYVRRDYTSTPMSDPAAADRTRKAPKANNAACDNPEHVRGACVDQARACVTDVTRRWLVSSASDSTMA